MKTKLRNMIDKLTEIDLITHIYVMISISFVMLAISLIFFSTPY